MDVFDRINQLLKEKNVKKSKLAKGADIPYSTLSSMLSSHPKKINYGIISKIAQFLDVETDFLFYGDSDFSNKLDKLAFNPPKNQDEYEKTFSDIMIKWQNAGDRTINHTDFIIEHVYDNGTKSSEKFSFYDIGVNSIVWTLYEFILKLALENNRQEESKAKKLLNDTKNELNEIIPPFSKNMKEDMESLNSLVNYYRKHINSLNVDIKKLESKLGYWKTKSFYPL